jgi:hypothetical protein
VVTLGWHRVDGPDFAHGQDDGQDRQRREAAVREAALPAGAPYSVQFVDVGVAPVCFEADLRARTGGSRTRFYLSSTER